MSGLSLRQAEVAALVSQGMTNVEVAHTLHVSVDTVKKHLTSALRITGCQNRTQLALAWQAESAEGIRRIGLARRGVTRSSLLHLRPAGRRPPGSMSCDRQKRRHRGAITSPRKGPAFAS
ncbi:response regulator transcription factor [Streptomyces sp. NBC_00079]|uniref:response regulator transcription factor n=1 Tax=Streptomyces sp. NBC_00079 TaxID=2975644 RepID=UPI003870ECA1